MSTTMVDTNKASSSLKKPAVLIVGGGSAGAVLAARLSENPDREVLLIEAGPNFAPHAYPINLSDAGIVGTSEFDWQYVSDDKVKLGHDIATPRGKVIGGSSAVNGTVAIRARPSDFARWTARGITEWSWSDVLPAYKALENTPTGEDHLHGRNGPFPIRQRSLGELTPSSRAFVYAAQAQGLASIEDFNGDAVNGAGPYSLNVVDEVRMNTGMTYLTDAVRARPNLTIRPGANVDQVVFDGKRATGVLLATGELVSANEVILSAGTFGSPAILMRSGIGPAMHLQSLGIPVVVDLPVGSRLQEHPLYYQVYALKAEKNGMSPAAGALVWTDSSRAHTGDLDLQISATHFFDGKNSPTGGAIVLAAALTLPRSIGSFEITSRNPQAAPRIRYNFLDHPEDLERMLEVVRLTRSIGKTEPFSDLVDSAIFPTPEVDDSVLAEHVRANISTYAHPTSTAPMGTDSDATAVVDPWGKVRGVSGLRVIDASIFPDIPSVPTNLTTIMLAERIAAKLSN